MIKGSCKGLQWFTALMLSPGMIFTSAYLLVWFSLNLYLDNTFKDELRRSFSSESGLPCRLTIGSLRSGPDLNSLTLKKLELIPIGYETNETPRGAGFQIAELNVHCPNLCFFPFRSTEASLSMHRISKEILSKYRSVNPHAGSLPAYRSDLVNRIGKDRQVGIP